MVGELTAVSLFAGVGGFDLALERNGVKVVASFEWIVGRLVAQLNGEQIE